MKPMLIAVGVFLATGLSSLNGVAGDDRVVDSYIRLRTSVLTIRPEQVGLNPGPSEVWGVLMETSHPEAVVSLVALADGTASLYFSNGGGIIGFGQHPGPQRAAKNFIAFAQLFARYGKPVKTYPFPELTFTRFYMLMGDRIVSVEAKEDDLGYGRHALSPLFHKGHELIVEMRALDEKLNVK